MLEEQDDDVEELIKRLGGDFLNDEDVDRKIRDAIETRLEEEITRRKERGYTRIKRRLFKSKIEEPTTGFSEILPKTEDE